jgi:hypothetical protein
MVTHLFEQYRTQVERAVRQAGVKAKGSSVTSAPRDEGERRREPRLEQWQTCTYEASEIPGEESVASHIGEAVALDHSQEGMLLLMEKPPTPTKMLEIHTPHTLGRKTLLVFDVRWVKPLQVPSLGECYLVGCRRTFGPYHYLQF